MRKLETINYRRNVENFPNLFIGIYFGSDNLIVFIEIILYFRRFRSSFVIRSRDYIAGKKFFISKCFSRSLFKLKYQFQFPEYLCNAVNGNI
jgi:hypothetical protein